MDGSGRAPRAAGGQTAGDWHATGVSIDTRTLAAGDLFVALKDMRDGHDFVRAALGKGAAAALVSRVPEGLEGDPRLLIAPDVLQALEGLGRHARARTSARVVGVTGSVGKTSTKEMLRSILGGQGRVHAAEASYNNHWGVPLTLARLPQDADFAVIEIGMNHPGEIAPLARMADLNVAMITTVAAAHLEAFTSVAAIATEKASILEGLRQDGIAVLPKGAPLGDDIAAILQHKADMLDLRRVTFGAASDADYALIRASYSQGATVVQAMHRAQPMLFKLSVLGAHFAANGLGALAVADALGLDRMMALTDLGRWTPPAGRGGREVIVLDVVEGHSFALLDDAFNANPASMAAALDVLAANVPKNGVGRVGNGRRIAILGDMLELGAEEGMLHAEIALHPAMAQIDTVHCVGPRMRALWQALPRGKRGEWVETAAELAAHARALIDAGDVILVKSSKGTKCALIVDALRKLGQSTGSDKGDI
ncbi:MAG: UDP-N-acetylmuramoyl-tripeptide--D-alanyl-D-alanine ligase [Cypionkella sp.]|nr:UDP-N-acetylmuramoyl-tripeptide--D-alanyl-D-alanine ligase [Cypionkella sp.]